MSNILRGLTESSFADQFMTTMKNKGINARLAGTPDQERERTEKELAQRAQAHANQPKPTLSPEEVEQLKAQLAKAKEGFDKDYEYSDDYTFWSQQNQKSQTIRSIEKQLRDAGVELNEVSMELLGRYKKAAGADARAADKEGDFKRGDKRFGGMIRATKKEFQKAAQNLSEEELSATAYDVMNHPKHGKVMWLNYGGAHVIAKKEPSGSLKIFSMGDHKDIAQKWKAVKDKLTAMNAKPVGMAEDWQKVNKSDKTDGMSKKAVKAYRRENPGSKLKTAVTKDPSKIKKGSSDDKRRKSFCARMSGMKKAHASAKTKRDPDSPINKALRRWNCEESVEESLRTENPCWKGYEPVGTKKKNGKTVPNCVPVKKESSIMKGIVDEGKE